jgi:hypothetical protein
MAEKHMETIEAAEPPSLDMLQVELKMALSEAKHYKNRWENAEKVAIKACLMNVRLEDALRRVAHDTQHSPLLTDGTIALVRKELKQYDHKGNENS